VDYLEGQGLRASTQAGFRAELSTTHQHFLLQHLIDKHQHIKKSLYGLVVDLKSAYDLVAHCLLWEMLRRAGVHGVFMSLIQAMYTTASMAVCVNGHVGPRMHPTIGVPQGCPLIPTLFSMALNDLHIHVLYAAAEHVPYLTTPNMPVTNLDYADDIWL